MFFLEPFHEPEGGAQDDKGEKSSAGHGNPGEVEEHGRQKGDDLRHGVGAEQEPAQANDMEHENPLQEGQPGGSGCGLLAGEERGNKAVDDEDGSLIGAPEYKRPGGAMPETAQQHGEHEIAVGMEGAMAIAAEGNVHIVPQPSGQADVPAAPKLFWIEGKIGAFEVPHEFEPQNGCQAFRHVAISGKIAVNLECKGIEGDEDESAGKGGVPGKHGIDQAAEVVGDDDFFEKPPENEPDALADLIGRNVARSFKLWEQRGGAFDGACHQLREKGDVGGEVNEVSGWRLLPAEDVNAIAHALERIKGDADGKHNVKGVGPAGKANGVEEPFCAEREEIEVFEEKQDAQIDEDADAENPFSVGFF